MAAKTSNLNLLRGLVRELRFRNRNHKVAKTVPADFILSQFKKFQVTSDLLCRQSEQAKSLGQAYYSYLESSRKHAEILHHYHGRGERTVADTAKLVGFKLPHDPKQ